MAQFDSSTDSPVAISHGLTALHIAVLNNDYDRVRKVVSEREHGVDERTANGTTALMLAALYGRNKIFSFLARKKASPNKKDSQGNNALDYVKSQSPFIQDLSRSYKRITGNVADRNGRREIYGWLKVLKHASEMAYRQGLAKGRAEPSAQGPAPAETQAQPQLQTSTNMNSPNAQQFSQDPSVRLVFLRSLNGKQQEVGEFREIGTAEHSDLGRKCTAFLFAGDGNDFHKFAVSGWGRAKQDKNAVFKNVLNSKDYTELVIRVAALLDFELKSNPFDHRFPGTPFERKGAYVACHSEKQLAVYVLIKALSHLFNTKALTVYNIVQVKNHLDGLPPELRETVIHLDHRRVCKSCAQFLEILTQKSGLIFRCQSHDWYTYGERAQLRRQLDGTYQPITGSTRGNSSSDDLEVIEDEIGAFDAEDTVDHEGDSLMVQSDPTTPTTPSNRRPSPMRQLVLRVPHDVEKRGSPVYEEPKHHIPRYTVPFVTPPSKKAQGMPTPRSHTRLAEIPRISISPSPADASSALAPQTDSISPSMSQEFEVEDILQTREDDGIRTFLVKWKGYPDDMNSWEPESNLGNASDAIRKFWEELRAIQSHGQGVDA